jgi:tetratricopeptide (TPR) repeat protein
MNTGRAALLAWTLWLELTSFAPKVWSQEVPAAADAVAAEETTDETAADVDAGSEPALPQPSSEVELAHAHFLRGMEYVERQLWEAALVEFDESLRLHPSSSALFNSALCLQHLQRFQPAMNAFRLYLARYRDQTAPDQLEQIERAIADLRAVLIEVRVEVNLDGAAISVDDVDSGLSPLAEPLMLCSGEHHLEVELEGYQRAERDLMVVSGHPVSARVELVPRSRFGLLRVVSETPGLRLTVDGHEVPIPYSGRLREGLHHLVARAAGHRTRSAAVTVEAEQQTVETMALERDRRVHRAWFYSLIGLTSAGAITVVGLGGRAVYYDRHYDPGAENAFEWYAEGRHLMIAADATLGVTLGLAAAALVLGFCTNWDRSDVEVRLTP